MRSSFLVVAAFVQLAVGGTATAVPVWPFAATPVVSRSFGSLENDELHAGIDIPAARGTQVRAVEDSTITAVGTDASGGGDVSDVYAQDAAGNEYYYGHIEKLTGQPELAVTDVLTKGTAFCQVRRAGTARSGSFGHLHFGYSRAADGTGLANRVDPLRYLFPANTVTEDITNHSLTLVPRDGKFSIYGQDQNARETGRYIKGNVDLLAEITDDMGGARFVGTEADDPDHRGTELDLFKGYTGTPTEIRYSIAKPTYVRRGDIAERTLEHFTGKQSLHTTRDTVVYDSPLRSIKAMNAGAPAGEQGGNKDNYSYKITATDGTTPDATHYWNTNSLLGGGGDGSGGTVIDTLLNASAQFQDGVYGVTSKAFTVNGQIGGIGQISSARTYDVLVNNFKQTAAPASGPGEAPSSIFGESDEANTGGAETQASPGVQAIFAPGADLYVKGAQYVDDWLYDAFVVPYKPIWTEGDAIAGVVSTAMVMSDTLGAINGQLLWESVAVGLYNIVIDYDDDGEFSWTLDGLGTFLVLALPGVFAPTLSAWSQLLLAALVGGAGRLLLRVQWLGGSPTG